jgi:hypothetical protein
MKMSRRQFLKLSALAGAGRFVEDCGAKRMQYFGLNSPQLTKLDDLLTSHRRHSDSGTMF